MNEWGVPTALERFTTDELFEELARRSDGCVLAMIIDRSGEISSWKVRMSGEYFRVLGLAAYLQQWICERIRESERPESEIEG